MQPAMATANTESGIHVLNETLCGTNLGDLHPELLVDQENPDATSEEMEQFSVLLPDDEIQPESTSEGSAFTGTELQTSVEAAQQDLTTIDKNVTSPSCSSAQEHVALEPAPASEFVALEPAPALEFVAKAPLQSKIARAVPPKSKMLRMQQIPAWSTSDPTITIQPPEILCTTPGSKVTQLRAPSPPDSDYSSSSSGTHRSIKSKASSTTSNESLASRVRGTHLVTNPPRRWIMKGRKIQPRGATASITPKGTDHELDNKVVSDIKPADDGMRRCPSTQAPDDVAAWIEQSDIRQPPLLQRSNSSHSSKSGDSNIDDSPTKQQRKKANRKARKAAIETAIQQVQEMEAEKAKREEARKEHQKIKKERKKIESVKGKGNKKTEKGKSEEQKGKGKKERKTGYLIG
jgi:hypothetical protein